MQWHIGVQVQSPDADADVSRSSNCSSAFCTSNVISCRPRPGVSMVSVVCIGLVVGVMKILDAGHDGCARCAAGSGIARLVGRMPLAKALMRTAAKHAVLGGAGLIPVLGTASAALAAVVDHRDFQDTTRSPSIADIVQLGR